MKYRRSGFTLVEMLGALALSALLLSAALGWVRSLAREQERLARLEPLGRDDWIAILQSDLATLRLEAAADKQVQLRGWDHDGSAVRVVWHVEQAAQRSWLLRSSGPITQTDECEGRLMAVDISEFQVRPAAGGVGTFEVEASGLAGTTTARLVTQ